MAQVFFYRATRSLSELRNKYINYALRQNSLRSCNHLTNNKETLMLSRTQLLERNTMELDAPSPATWGQLLGQSHAFPGAVSLVALGARPPRCPQPADTFILSLTAWSIPGSLDNPDGCLWVPEGRYIRAGGRGREVS